MAKQKDERTISDCGARELLTAYFLKEKLRSPSLRDLEKLESFLEEIDVVNEQSFDALVRQIKSKTPGHWVSTQQLRDLGVHIATHANTDSGVATIDAVDEWMKKNNLNP